MTSKKPSQTTTNNKIQVSTLIPNGNPEADFTADFGIIPMAEATDQELNMAHMNTLDLTFPAHIRAQYNAAGWVLKWARYQKNGEYDHENMSKYFGVLGGRFVPLDEIAQVDPNYAATLQQSSYKGPLAVSKNETIVTKGFDLALVAYKKAIADRRRASTQAASDAALSQVEKKIRQSGLDVKEFSDSAD